MISTLDPSLWAGSFASRESSMHQLAPYVGKMKTGMARVLIERFSQAGEVVLDPFAGSGVVSYESVLLGRQTIASDLSPYAYVLTLGKLTAPVSEAVALREAEQYITRAEAEAKSVRADHIPAWVRAFFHPRTIREVVSVVRLLRAEERHFLLACVLGILHHVRPGFLSYPASHLTPYLRERNYPRDQYPGMYAYRDLRSRLLAKVRRAYRRAPAWDRSLGWQVLRENTMSLSLASQSVDAVISSPPYFGALDYARDNRLRLWFLGVEDYHTLERELTSKDQVYVEQMSPCLSELHRVLKPGRHCVLVLGDVERNGSRRDTAGIISELAAEHGFVTEALIDDHIPDDRRSRRRTRTTKRERVLVMRASPQGQG